MSRQRRQSRLRQQSRNRHPSGFLRLHHNEFWEKVFEELCKCGKIDNLDNHIKNIKEINYKGIYKYYYGATDSFSEVLKIQTEVRKKIPDAFVVSFKNGKRIPLDQALKETGRR